MFKAISHWLTRRRQRQWGFVQARIGYQFEDGRIISIYCTTDSNAWTEYVLPAKYGTPEDALHMCSAQDLVRGVDAEHWPPRDARLSRDVADFMCDPEQRMYLYFDEQWHVADAGTAWQFVPIVAQ